MTVNTQNHRYLRMGTTPPYQDGLRVNALKPADTQETSDELMTSKHEVYGSFARILDIQDLGGVRIDDWLIANRVLHINTPRGDDQAMRLIVGETDKSTTSPGIACGDPGEPMDDEGRPNKVTSHSYVYRPGSFFVAITDGFITKMLDVDRGYGQHFGKIDDRGIDGTYEPGREIITLYCIDEKGEKHKVEFNRETGNGMVCLKDGGGNEMVESWILGASDSNNIIEAERLKAQQVASSLGGTSTQASRV